MSELLQLHHIRCSVDGNVYETAIEWDIHRQSCKPCSELLDMLMQKSEKFLATAVEDDPEDEIIDDDIDEDDDEDEDDEDDDSWDDDPYEELDED